jgi:ParB family chromosome partitioning protein
MAEEPRLRLGRGLAALIGDTSDGTAVGDRNRSLRRVPIELLRANPSNPRKVFDDVAIEELADSLKEKGMLQPIVVRERPGASDCYEIVAGERRWRAAQRAALHAVPVIVIDASDKEALEIAIIENVQRSDLNPLEESEGYAQLLRDYHYTQADLAKIIGKSRSHVANTLRLANLPDVVKQMVNAGRLSAGHARALLGTADPERIANKIVSEGLTVREAERLAQGDELQRRALDGAPSGQPRESDPDTRALEKSLQEVTGLAIRIQRQGDSGQIRIRYQNLDQLEQITDLLRAYGKA